MTEPTLFIDGTWRHSESGGTRTIVCPADGTEVAVVDDAVRPVPLEMEYVVEPIGELLQRLVGQDKAPVYVVHFSQKEAVERSLVHSAGNRLSIGTSR